MNQLANNARLLETVLDDFNVKGSVVAVSEGPVVTRYELLLAPGTKATKVVGLATDIARNLQVLAARVAIIPGRAEIGIEVPNATRQIVNMKELTSSAAFNNTMTLPIVLGKDIAGEAVVVDLASMPHLLVAGTTGSGKSVGLNAMIVSLLMRMGPEDLRFIMIDPKMLEFTVYNGIPHLLTPVVTEAAQAIKALEWVCEEMERRYRLMSKFGVRNLAGYNEKALKKMPNLVVIVDELADLMTTAGKQVEVHIQRIAQKARAAGIHIILATQRPSVDVITGVIKANLPTRIAFSVASSIDSRTIIGEEGAEQLLGKGDMLYMNGRGLQRIHGPFVTDEEVQSIVDHWKDKASPAYISGIVEEEEILELVEITDEPEAVVITDHYEELAKHLQGGEETTLIHLQRKLGIQLNEASALLDLFIERGFIRASMVNGKKKLIVA